MLDQLVGGLNENQRLAVEWDSGRLLVLAGPGSGKTHVLTLRIARLIAASPNEFYRVLGLTFTQKAASEMKTRVDELLGEDAGRTFITTFHSFAADLLRQHGSHLGIRPDFTILNQDEDRAAVLAEAIDATDPPNLLSTDDVRLLPVINHLLENVVDDQSIGSFVRDPAVAQKAAVLYPAYRAQLIAGNRMDFPALLYFGYQLLINKPAVAQQLRTVYPRLCIDEFQDTNLAQYEFLRAMAGNSPFDLFVVADDDQIIYQWNGASPERLAALRDDYDMKVIQLPGNYRCPPEVIALANKLITHNPGRPPDKLPLVAIKPATGPHVVQLVRLRTENDEARWIADDLHDRSPTSWSKSVVLARTRRLVELAASALEDRGVLASLAIRKLQFDSAPARWLYSMLRLADGRGDREQLRRACKAFYELEGINVRVDDVIAQSASLGGDLLRAWFQDSLGRAELSADARTLLESASALIVDRLEFSKFIDEAMSWLDLRVRADVVDGAEAFADFEEEGKTLRELITSAQSRFGRELTLHALLHEIDLAPKAPPPPPQAVRCLTIHNAKGMEFDHVYLIGLADDQLPSYQAIKRGATSLEMQEERRNCFVAITRTQESLTLTLADSYFGWGKSPSRFLNEMGLVIPPRPDEVIPF